MRYALALLGLGVSVLTITQIGNSSATTTAASSEAVQKQELKQAKSAQPKEPRVWGFTVADQTHSWVFHAYPEMSVSQIQQIFKDHLKQFPKKYAKKLAIHLRDLCEGYSFDPAFILAVIYAESAFRSKVVSFKGAVGLMQILPSTAQYVARKKKIRYRSSKDLSNPFTNLSIGVAYLASLRDKYNGSMRHFLSAYNAGPGRVDHFLSRNIFNRLKTRHYVEKIRRKTPSLRTYGKSIRMVNTTERESGV